MCGLAGFLGGTMGADQRRDVARQMADRIRHRGPDDSGEWVDSRAGLAFGFRRLSVVDLSPAGHQPMISASGRFVIVFNGEVYNFEAIREELVDAGLAPDFRGHSDTEVLLAAFEAWGVAAAVRRFIGIFAIALWDRERQELHLIRDRMGVKPLYWGCAGETILFASQLNAFHAHPDFRPVIDRDALALYFRFTYVPAPFTIYEGIAKLPPGAIVTISSRGEARTEVYWSAAEAAERGLANRFRGTFEDASRELDALLRDAVRLRMIADVPLGVFLSGGIDSSIVTAYMQAQSATPVKTFSIGSPDSAHDEAQYAARVARHLGTQHEELYVSADDALDVIQKLPSIYDEPFADSSQIPTYIVSAMARRQVTVCLSGDGGDELFGGYNHYFLGQRTRQKIARIPRLLRRPAARAITAVRKESWDTAFRLLKPMTPRSLRQNRPGERLHKLARVMAATDDEDSVYFEIGSHWRSLVIGGGEAEVPLLARSRRPRLPDPIERMMYFDQVSYLPDDILVKVDRASMAVSLETREPLLDHRLVEFAWTLPLSMKVKNGRGKLLLRSLLCEHVPRELVDRPKMGFGVPVGDWIRGPLRSWAESLLDGPRMRREGFLDAARVTEMWRAHLAGHSEWQSYLWTVLMFQSWAEAQNAPASNCLSVAGA
jgi:asparagine synthase (glutamine-hydrolysing)